MSASSFAPSGLTTLRASDDGSVGAVDTDRRMQRLQAGLFSAGAVLMPLGLITIFLGWYGAAHAHYSYDQFPYLISGGVLGLGFTFIGGFLYFGAWVAKLGRDQKEASRQVAEALLHMADMMARQQTAPVGKSELAEGFVLAGQGTTVHRSDCALIAQRDDLRQVPPGELGLTRCRVCRADWAATPVRTNRVAVKVSR